VRDNKTSQPAQEYDSNINKTIPMYRLFHEQTLDLVETLMPQPQTWLDAGCGTGILACEAVERFSQTLFTLADPSAAMVEIAQFKLPQQRRCTYIPAGTEDLTLPADSFDVITAILSHHYASPEIKRRITENCYRMLKPGGVYINFESIRPLTATGLQIGLDRWRRAQLRAGKSPEAVTKHISRYGIEFLPITVAEHLKLLNGSGFTAVELFWSSYLQAGFYAIK
jgi:tRNA (cmo5U34)-methyltransferase